MTYVSVESVRRTIGIGSQQISDTDVESIIVEVEPQIERYYNTVFTPKERIDVLDGNGTTRIFVDKNPLLAVRELKIDGTTEDPANLFISKESGKVELDSNSDLSTSNYIQKHKAVIIKYIYGLLNESDTNTSSDDDSIAGTSVALSVVSETGFAEDDWVEIYGMDGYREVAKITATDVGELTIDQLVYTHESGSTIVKLEIMEIITKLMNIVCALAMVARIVGESYTDIVGYSLGELQVQKGEPYTQWRETAAQLIKERNDIMERIKIRPYVTL